MPGTDPLLLDEISLLLVWTAVAIYVLAFIAYAIDLARRSDLALKAKDEVVARELVTAGGGGVISAGGGSSASTPSAKPRYLWARLGTVLTALGFVFHLVATVLRGVAAERVPWSNMYEFALTGLLLIIAVYLAVLTKFDLRFLGALMTGLAVLLLGGATLAFHVEVVPLADPLKSVWLVVHVFVASLATALFALAFGLSVVQLIQTRRERKLAEASMDAAPSRGFLRTVPNAEALESLAYRFAIVGFIFWTFTLIAGSIWANDAWGRFWGFDTKEVWTFVIWVLYAGYIHARATRGWRGTRSAWLSIIGFTAVLFNFTIVNVFFKGLHAYSGLTT